MAKKKDTKKTLISVNQTVADNRRARFDYFLEDRFDAGIVLTGTEVKSLRLGLCSINESYAVDRGGEIWLVNSHIAEYTQAGAHLQHAPKRERKLLLKKKETNRLIGAVTREGYTIVPVRLYFNAKGIAKLEIALAKGKKDYDKRETEKQRDWGREKQRIIRKGE